MKALINRIDQFFFRYRKLIKMIDGQATIKTTLKSVFGALLLSVLTILIPILILVNMFIISKLTLFLAILILIFIVAWPFLYYYLYYALLKNYHPKIQDFNIKIPFWTESTLISIILLIIGIVVLTVIF